MNSDAAIKHVFEEWHRATVAHDLDALAALYAEDASFESPTVMRLLGQNEGIAAGRAAIRNLLEKVYSKVTGAANEWYRTGAYFTDGNQLIWEYPRKTPMGVQADIVEVMEIRDGLITLHKVYWGWHGLQGLPASEARVGDED